MTPIGEFLKEKTQEQMDFHKREASGEAMESIQERITNRGIQIVGIDYWEYINEGRTSGGMPPIDKIKQWMQDKSRRFGVVFDEGAEWGIAKNIAKFGAPQNKAGLKITEQVIQKNKTELNNLVKTHINGRLSINN